ncbi:MAG: PepSY domain-containing protein [Steroidobacteraceae bacterium]
MFRRFMALLVALHLYMGMALCLLFVVWFISGVAMVYYRLPVLNEDQRLAFEPAWQEAPTLAPAQIPALAQHWPEAETLRLAQWRGRPLYRWLSPGEGWRAAWADTGETATFDGAMLEPEARRWLGAGTSPAYLGEYRAQGQWSYFSGARAHYPLHRFSTGGFAPREVFLSSRTGEVVVATTAGSRLLYYLGPGLHYFSFYPIRNREALWRGLVNWSSGFGGFICLTGIVLGIWRLRWNALGTPRKLIPYKKFWMYWHHWLGLAFGLLALTFVLSGLFSMNPGSLFPHTTVPAAVQAAWLGERPSVQALPGAPARAVLADMREYEYRRDGGEVLLHAIVSPTLQRRLDTSQQPAVALPPYTAAELIDRFAAHAGAPVASYEWLTAFDTYYYGRKDRFKPLPVLRARLADAAGTWYYLDTATGQPFLKSDQGTRVQRWLYNGLHSFDLPQLLHRPVLWTLLIWGLSIAGLALCITSVVISWRWLKRKLPAAA